MEQYQNTINLRSKSIVKSRSKKLHDAQKNTRPNKLNQVHIDHIVSDKTLNN